MSVSKEQFLKNQLKVAEDHAERLCNRIKFLEKQIDVLHLRKYERIVKEFSHLFKEDWDWNRCECRHHDPCFYCAVVHMLIKYAERAEQLGISTKDFFIPY